MFNNQKFAAAATAVALGVCAVIAPQAQGATVGANTDGVCTLSLNDQEKQEYRRIAYASTHFNMDDTWREAFETAFPAAQEISSEFKDYYRGAEREAFNNNLMENLNLWSKRVASETGVSQDASFWYFSYVWNDLATSSDADLSLATYWDSVDQALQAGEIVANEDPAESVFTPVPPLAELEKDRKEQFPELASHDAAAWADAFENSQALQDYRLGASFETAFEQASLDCAKGGDTFALFPTAGENPDAKRAAERTAERTDQGAIVVAPAEEETYNKGGTTTPAPTEERNVTVNEDGSTTTRIVRTGTNTSLDVTVTTRANSADVDINDKEKKQAAGKSQSKTVEMDNGLIAAIVLAVLATLGGVAASLLG